MNQSTVADQPLARRSHAFRSWGLLRVPIGVLLAIAIIILYVIAALAPTLLQTHDPFNIDLSAPLRSPSLSHWLGTDSAGRDLYSRIVEGTRQSLFIGVGATLLSMAIALFLGISAGLGSPALDRVISRLLDVLFAFPILFLAVLFVTVFGTTVVTQIVAVGIGTAPGYARMVRGQVLTVRGAGYVEAAKVQGNSPRSIILVHILPNALHPLVAMVTLGIGQAIVWASGLSLLGLGVPPPAPEWGALLDAGRNFVTRAWWLEVMPGVAIVVIAVSVTVVGRFLQTRLGGKGDLV